MWLTWNLKKKDLLSCPRNVGRGSRPRIVIRVKLWVAGSNLMWSRILVRLDRAGNRLMSVDWFAIWVSDSWFRPVSSNLSLHPQLTQRMSRIGLVWEWCIPGGLAGPKSPIDQAVTRPACTPTYPDQSYGINSPEWQVRDPNWSYWSILISLDSGPVRPKRTEIRIGHQILTPEIQSWDRRRCIPWAENRI